jgi:acetyl-CoA carboxylase biotin carboxyl carrier protein
VALNFKEIIELIDKVADRGIAAVEIEQAGTRLRIEGKAPAPAPVVHSYVTEAASPAPPPLAVAAPAPAASTVVDEPDAGLHIITSPIVGTFYRSPSPEAASFVQIGDRIAKGQVLCIIEAMKLMNEIESDADGVITQIYPQNGQPIEYGEKLFAVRMQ